MAIATKARRLPIPESGEVDDIIGKLEPGEHRGGWLPLAGRRHRDSRSCRRDYREASSD